MWRVCLSLLMLGAVSADDETHMYAAREPVALFVNKVGPYHNPHEVSEQMSPRVAPYSA